MMELSKETEIEITTFINPHLFWILIKNEERGKLLTILQKQMQEYVTVNHDKDSWSNFDIGEIVAAEINNRFYRAVIEDIVTENVSKHFYVLWLIDYGTMRESVTVFKLPTPLRKTPPLSLQASLNDIVYIEQVLDYDSFGQLAKIKKHVINPSSTSRQESITLLSGALDLKFKLERKEDGIIFGDVLYKDKYNHEISLRNSLLTAGVVDIDNTFFEGITDFINNYKENHLMVISQICNKEPYPLEGDKNKEVDRSCMTIVSKILDEFHYSDLLSFEDEVSEPLWSFNKSKNTTSNSLDNTMSDSESPIKIKSKKSQLMEKLWQHKKNSEHSNEEKCDSKPNSVPSVSKIKKLCEQMKQCKNKAKPVTGRNMEATRNNRRIIFGAAGSERTFVQPQMRKTYQKNEQKADKSSRNKKFHQNQHNELKSPIKIDDTSSMENSSCQENKTGEDDKSSSLEESSTSETVCTNLQSVQTMKIKPHCSCKQCGVWTKEENVFVEDLGSLPKVARIDATKTQLLFKEIQNSVANVEICAIDYASMKKIEKRATQKLLVHSEIILNPIHQISKVAFHKDIHTNLNRLEYREAKRIQSHAWPAILRNQHVFMIHGPQSGKTMAYLPVMLTFVLEKHDRYDSLMKVAGGPIVIILCGNTYKCEEVYDLAKVLLRNIRASISLVTYPVAHVNTSHTDMLITTPNILVDLLKNKSVNFKRLCHLIIEDGDTILTKQKDVITAIFELAQSMLKNRVFTKALQLIVCAEHWNSQIKYLMNNLQQVPMVCIGNYLEATLYGQVEFSMKFINSACKEQELKHLLKDTHRIYRSIIVCKESEIEEIQEILTLKGIDNIPLAPTMSQEDIQHHEDVWTEAKGGTYAVLICSDFLLHTVLSVTCATVLIHYSLPKSWTKFVNRFSCLLENCRSPLDTKEAKIISKNVVLCDESCKDQMYKFFNYINSSELKKQLPEKLREFSKTLESAEEDQKLEREIGLCEKLKLYGKCSRNVCVRRHIISSDLDISNFLPKSGKVKFKIVNVIDVTLYSIQLLQHVDNENKIHEYDEVCDVTEDLTATLRLGKKKIYNPVVGHRYAFYNFDEQEGNYYRCTVMDVEDDCVKIKLLDKGSIVSTLTSRLYRLPKEFDCDIKPRAIIDAYLANCIPPYQDENFSAKSFFKLKTLLEECDYKNIIFTGDVHLQLDSTLWLKDVCQEVVLSGRIIRGFQLSRDILLKKLADNNPSQLSHLYKLCTDAGITLPKCRQQDIAVVTKKPEVKNQWAFLDSEQVNEVTFAAAFSPDEVYVRLNKFSGLLYTLQKEIQEVVKKPHYPKLQEVTVGGVYLAKDPDGLEYCRVLVLKKETNQALCFYVDFADEAVIPLDDLKYIQDSFITTLPFQCIQCRLYGIKPVGDGWDEDVTNTLYNYAHEPGTDIFRSLFLKVCQKESSTSVTNAKYSVLLKDGFSEKKVLINQLLVECGMVVSNSEESLNDFEIPAVQLESPESDEDLTEVADIYKKTHELDQYFQANSVPPINRKSGDGGIQINLAEMEFMIIGDAEVFWNQQLNQQPDSTRNNNELPAITAAPAVDYCTPEVYWSQTENNVKLSIRLTDVQDCKLTLAKGRMFNFRTIQNEKTYCLKLMFYDHIETVQHTLTGSEVRVTLTKSKNIDWPRLVLSKQKTRNIHYDISKIPVEEEDRKILQLPKEFDDESSDEPDEEDPMYTVYSDLDSDLDIELENDSD